MATDSRDSPGAGAVSGLMAGSSLPADTMRAVMVRVPGGPQALERVRIPEPRPSPGEVRVRAQAIGVGKPDVMVRRGIYPWMPPLPAIPGNELAGVIDAVGPGVEIPRLGDRVLVSSRELAQRGGCYAEAICVPADAVYALPASVSAVDAVALGNYQLALALLFEAGAVAPRSVLVHGAAGGVGTALLQTARARGMLAIGVASNARKCAFARAAGASHMIDRSMEDVRSRVHELTGGTGVDMVLDPIGGPGFTDGLDLLAARGTLMSYGIMRGLPDKNLLGELRRLLGRSLAIRSYSIHELDHEPALRRSLMIQAIDLVASGAIVPPAATIFRLDEVREAHETLDAAQVLGKLVLIP